MSEKVSGAEQKSMPAIQIANQYIKDLSLEVPHAPEIFSELRGNPDIKINVDIQAQSLPDEMFEVSLNFRIDGDVKDKKFCIIEMAYCGLVKVHVPEEHLQPVLMIEIPHMLFPYARQAISSAMFNAGLPPLMLNPIDFVAMYKAKAGK